MTVVAWGAGQYFMNVKNHQGFQIQRLVDGDPMKWGTIRLGYTVEDPGKVFMEVDPAQTIVLIFAPGAEADIRNTLLAYGPFPSIPMSGLPAANRSPAQDPTPPPSDALHKLLPLNTPTFVLVDPSDFCNFKCTFCPTGDEALVASRNRKNGFLSLELFRKVLDDLKAFSSKVPILSLHKDGEPYLNRNLEAMIAEAKAAKVADWVCTTTNGSFLTPERIHDTIAAGLDLMTVSIKHAHNEGYADITGTRVTYRQILESVRLVHEEKLRLHSSMQVVVRITDTGLSESERAAFASDFKPWVNQIDIGCIFGWGNSGSRDFMLGLDPKFGIDGRSPVHKGRRVCCQPFRMVCVNPDGRVSACCGDWSKALIVGDVNRERLIDIWQGEALRNIRRIHLLGLKDSLNACVGCQFMEGLPDSLDLDAHASELIEKFS